MGIGNVQVIDLADEICDAVTCRAYRDGVWIYRDGAHLSVDGALILTDHFVEVLGGAL
ncbi:MAG: SGNH hydrolase domain-containing protein [Acidimicrobiales bacterium]